MGVGGRDVVLDRGVSHRGSHRGFSKLLCRNKHTIFSQTHIYIYFVVMSKVVFCF